MFNIFKNLVPLKKSPPLILQSEIAECGLACVAMLIGYFQAPVTLSTLRRQHRSSLKGLTLQQLIKIAAANGLTTRVMRIDLNHMETLRLPCIIHWNMNHFVVITKISKNFVELNDPAIGKRKVKHTEFLDSFTGIVLEVADFKPVNRQYQNMQYAKNLFYRILKQRLGMLAKLLFLSGSIQLFYILAVSFSKHAIDSNTNHFTQKILLILILGFFGAKLAEIAASALRMVMVTVTGTVINAQLGITVMKKILQLPLSFFENRHVGDIISRFGTIDKARSILTEGLIEGLVDGVVSIITLIAMFYCHAIIAAIVLVFTTAFIIARSYLNTQYKLLNEEALHAKANEISYFMESMRSITAIKIFMQEANRIHQWKNRFTRSLNTSSKITIYKSRFEFLKNLLYGFDMSFVLALGCYYMQANALTMGGLFAFIAFRQQFVLAVGNLVDKFQDFRLLALHMDRLDDIVGEPNEPALPFPAQTLFFNHTLAINNITFRYPMDEKPILKGLSLVIKKGECVAITGPSGMGKTTLLKIMMGLLTPEEGELLLDGQPIHHASGTYRKMVSAVMQEDMLLSGSILENISFFAKNVDLEKALECARLAAILDEINSFPMQWNTLIGEMGSVLSGGQKQRLLLARALYAEPQILFLDEASSHLDLKKEREINQSLRSLGLTIVMIAHRHETISIADRVIDLSDIKCSPDEAQRNPGGVAFC